MKKKQHWTQTHDGRRKMALIQHNRWAKQRLPVDMNGASVRNKLAAATTIEQLNEVKSFLDLRDELMGRLP